MYPIGKKDDPDHLMATVYSFYGRLADHLLCLCNNYVFQEGAIGQEIDLGFGTFKKFKELPTLEGEQVGTSDNWIHGNHGGFGTSSCTIQRG